MQYLPLVILLIFISLLSVMIDRRRLRNLAAAAQQAAPTVKQAADAATTSPPGIIARLTNQWSQRFGRKPPVPDDPVRTWLTSVFVENPAERLWFAALTAEQFKLLRSELTTFCAGLGFDLLWLVDQTAFKPATLEEAGKTIVTHYCRAVRAAVLVHDDINALQRYQAFLANPSSKENLAFAQQLFARLVDEKIAPTATPELLMAEEKERQTFVVQAIQTAAEQNNVVFHTVLKAVVLGIPQPNNTVTETSAPLRNAGASAAHPTAA